MFWVKTFDCSLSTITCSEKLIPNSFLSDNFYSIGVCAMILLNDEKTDRIYFHCTANKCQNWKDTLTIHYDSTYHDTEVEFDCRTRILQSYIAKSTVIIFLLLNDLEKGKIRLKGRLLWINLRNYRWRKIPVRIAETEIAWFPKWQKFLPTIWKTLNLYWQHFGNITHGDLRKQNPKIFFSH